MKIIHAKEDIRNTLKQFRKANPDATIGFVPTMGYLHEGHISLLKKSRNECDLSVASVFINPTQFNDPEDYLKYPADIEGDQKKCHDASVDILFMPSKEEMYPSGNSSITLSIPSLGNALCGKFRHGHFEGVLLIVSRLFHLVQPDKAYFGKKDYQQYRMIQRMVQELDFPLEVVGQETVRERDGLAMSSRNARLNAQEREQASLVSRSLRMVIKAHQEGCDSVSDLKEIAKDIMESGSLIRIEYIDIVDPESLEDIEELNEAKEFLIAAAVHIGNVRLIDNIESLNS